CRIGSKAYVSPASGLAGSDRFGFKCRRECDAAFACLLELDRYAYHGSHIREEFSLRSDRTPPPTPPPGGASSISSAAPAGARAIQARSDYASEIRERSELRGFPQRARR